MQADRLTPAQLRFRAWVKREIARWSSLDNTTHTLLMDEAESLEEEAARREAEGKVQSAATGHYENDCEELGREDSAAVPQTQTQGEREGPDSAAAPNAWRRECPHSNVMCESPVCREYGCQAVRGEAAIVPEDKPAPADDLVAKLDDWDRDLCDRQMPIPGHPTLLRLAIDRIEAQAREIADYRRRLGEEQYMRGMAENRALNNSHEKDKAEARVRELERECGQWQEASGQANVRAEQLEDKWEAEKARADKAEARVRELEAHLDAERTATKVLTDRATHAEENEAHEKARADGLAANNATLIEALKLCRELADHIAKAPLPLFRAQAAKVRECIDAALTEGGA